ncbi:hypothetical protein HK102_002631, partial [Quaeritorhiza haematococci]
MDPTATTSFSESALLAHYLSISAGLQSSDRTLDGVDDTLTTATHAAATTHTSSADTLDGLPSQFDEPPRETDEGMMLRPRASVRDEHKTVSWTPSVQQQVNERDEMDFHAAQRRFGVDDKYKEEEGVGAGTKQGKEKTTTGGAGDIDQSKQNSTPKGQICQSPVPEDGGKTLEGNKGHKKSNSNGSGSSNNHIRNDSTPVGVLASAAHRVVKKSGSNLNLIASSTKAAMKPPPHLRSVGLLAQVSALAFANKRSRGTNLDLLSAEEEEPVSNSISSQASELYESPLLSAIRTGEPDTLNAIIDDALRDPDKRVNFDVSMRDLLRRGPEGENILHLALLFGCLYRNDQERQRRGQVVGTILQRFPGVFVQDRYRGIRYKDQSCLHLAASSGDFEIVKMLVEEEMLPIDSETDGDDFKMGGLVYSGSTPLSFAAVAGQCKIVRYLLDKGADPSLKDGYGNNVLHVLSYHGLFTSSANVNKDECVCAPHEHSTYWLIRRFLEKKTRDGQWQTYMDEDGRDPMSARNNDGLTPLLVAVERGHVGVLDTLQEPMWKHGLCSSYLYPVEDIDTWVDPAEKHLYKNGRRPCALSIAIKNQNVAMINHPALLLPLRVKWEKDYIFGGGLFDSLIQLTIFFCIFTAAILRRYPPEKDRFHKGDAEFIFLGFAAIIGWVFIFTYAKGLQTTGPLVIIFYRVMTKDLLAWFIIWIFLFIGFAQAFYLQMLVSPEETGPRQRVTTGLAPESDIGLMLESFMMGFRFLLGDQVFDNYKTMRTRGLAVVLFAIYIFATSILLLNLLIAVLNNSFTKIYDQGEKQWQLVWATLVLQIDGRLSCRPQDVDDDDTDSDDEDHIPDEYSHYDTVNSAASMPMSATTMASKLPPKGKTGKKKKKRSLDDGWWGEGLRLFRWLRKKRLGVPIPRRDKFGNVVGKDRYCFVVNDRYEPEYNEIGEPLGKMVAKPVKLIFNDTEEVHLPRTVWQTWEFKEYWRKNLLILVCDGTATMSTMGSNSTTGASSNSSATLWSFAKKMQAEAKEYGISSNIMSLNSMKVRNLAQQKYVLFLIDVSSSSGTAAYSGTPVMSSEKSDFPRAAKSFDDTKRNNTNNTEKDGKRGRGVTFILDEKREKGDWNNEPDMLYSAENGADDPTLTCPVNAHKFWTELSRVKSLYLPETRYAVLGIAKEHEKYSFVGHETSSAGNVLRRMSLLPRGKTVIGRLSTRKDEIEKNHGVWRVSPLVDDAGNVAHGFTTSGQHESPESIHAQPNLQPPPRTHLTPPSPDHHAGEPSPSPPTPRPRRHYKVSGPCYRFAHRLHVKLQEDFRAHPLLPYN